MKKLFLAAQCSLPNSVHRIPITRVRRVQVQEGQLVLPANRLAYIHFDAPARSQGGDSSRDIRRDAQAEGHVVLSTGWDDPQGSVCASQGSSHDIDGAVAPARSTRSMFWNKPIRRSRRR